MRVNEPMIACVGMTHLGLIHAAAFAEKGFQVLCFDEKYELIQQLQAHHLPINEPELSEQVENNAKRLHFSNDFQQLRQCSLVFIAADVPTDEEGNSHLNVIDDLIAAVMPNLSDLCCLIILSQVPPGYTRAICSPNNPVFYQVETLIFGRAVERARHPERYIIGVNDPNLALPAHYQQLLSSFHCPILTMRYESAELAKISINMFLVSSVTTTNTLAEMCEHIGADWEEIAPALRLDKRIGQHAYLSPGLGLSGGNLERDLNTLVKLGRCHATDTGVVDACLANSRYRRDWVFNCLQFHVLPLLKAPVIAILGLAYKPDTDSIKNSPAIALISKLKNYSIRVHDPVAISPPFSGLVQHKEYFETIKDADVLIIMTPWAEYQQLTFEAVNNSMRGQIIIDPYRVLSCSAVDGKSADSPRKTSHYFTLGQQPVRFTQKEWSYV